MAAITISNLRITPYTQKNTIKPVYGDTMTLAFALPEPFVEGDDYILALDYERVLVPTARPLCALATEYTIDAGNITFALEIRTARFRDWVSSIKKPMPVWLQIQRKRDGVYDTLLLDDVLALPSVADGDNTVYPGDPLLKLLEDKLDKPAEAGKKGDVLKLGADGEPVWGEGGGGGLQVQADWDESDSSEPSYIQNKPEIPEHFDQVQADWDESDSSEPSYIQNKPEIPAAQVQSDWDESDSTDVAYIQHKPQIYPTLMLDSAPTTSTAGHLTQQAFVASTGKTYQLIGIDDSDPSAPVYNWTECITSANLPAIPPVGLSGSGAPTTSTAGKILQDYIDNDTQRVYTCTAITNTGTEAEPVYSYTWREDVNAKGGFLYENAFLGIGGYGSSASSRSFSVGSHNIVPQYSILVGTYLAAHTNNTLAFGGGYVSEDVKLYNASSGYRLEFNTAGNLRVSGGFQNTIHEIPSSTSRTSLTEGVSTHVPNSSSIYALTDATCIVVSPANYKSNYYTRAPSHDGDGYYAWNVYGYSASRYTAAANPSVGDNTYTNKALTQNAKPVTAIDNRTHEVILTILFRGYYRYSTGDSGSAYCWKANDGTLLYTDTTSITEGTTVAYSDTALTESAGTIALYDSVKTAFAMVGSYSFEDAAGNAIVPLSTPTIEVGSAVTFLCRWEALLGQWVIMPIPVGKEQVPA